MDNFEKLFPKNLYHSYVIEGEPSTTATELLNFLEARGEIEKQSPDVLCQVYDSFTMDNKEEIRDWYNRLGISKSKKVCILATKFINREVEQTLLKMIEEIPLNSHFFIIVPDASILAGTILSRVHLIKTKQSNIEIQKEILDFISVSPKEKIDKITLIIKENKDEGNSGQLRYYATTFVNELESVFYKKFKEDINNKKNKFILNELQKSREYLSTPGASVKMILENLALVI